MNILYIKINKLRIKSKTSLFMRGSSNIFYERLCELKKESNLKICFCFPVQTNDDEILFMLYTMLTQDD